MRLAVAAVTHITLARATSSIALIVRTQVSTSA